MATDSTHFVKYRLKSPNLKEQYITFSSRAPMTLQIGRDHPLVQKLAETDSKAASNVEQLIQELLTHEKRFFAWLGASESHMEQFMNDPVSALKLAIPDLPDSFFNQLDSLPKVFQKKA
ncbi:hypothetical protein [Halomonas sp. TD01]|uniref:hypothetical protein n=1 Tax=Halomonas sp. TD01 TaxID=999141 RepID=UPI000214F95B|nr:hypothetical protein [Halomonas sp. TD01]EGP19393.1 hypothetical protein GME_11592 [Halomonas sp. TD01]CAH1044977.1 hypothetical protein HPTD01_3455 [Halomonas sp. TD01]